MQTLFMLSASLLVGADALKVTVLGGTGFTGSRVCKALVEGGAEVCSVSKSGSVPTWCAGEAWTQQVEWRANELTRGAREKLQDAIGTPDAVVSCIGAIGFDVQGLKLGNGVANLEAAKAAKDAGAKRMAYVSVASEVAGASIEKVLPFFSGYFDGKADAEAAIAEAFGDEACFVRPSFIYGGESFGLFPPRVSSWYGSFIEELLSQDIFVKLADAAPGIIGVAFRPPVNVDAVAAACAAHALGTSTASDLDGTAAINGVAGLPPASGLTDAMDALKGKFAELTEA